MSTTALGLKQRRTALTRANEIRNTKADLKRIVGLMPTRRESAAMLADAIENYSDDPAIGRATVFELVKSVYRIGHEGVRQVMNAMGCSDHRRIESLSPRQLTCLLDWLREL